MKKYMMCDGVMVKKGIKAKGARLDDVSAELGRSHAYLSNCLSQGYLQEHELKYICAKYEIPYADVKRGYAKGTVTLYKSVRTKDKLRAEAKAAKLAEADKKEIKPEAKPVTELDEKIDLILSSMETLNRLMVEILRRGGK